MKSNFKKRPARTSANLRVRGTAPGLSFFDQLEMFNQTFNWIARAERKLRRQKPTPWVRLQYRELAVRLEQLKREYLRFTEA